MSRARAAYPAALALGLLLGAGAAVAEEMRFLPGGDDTRCRTCDFVQAYGTITRDTPARFRDFVAAQPYWMPRRLRLHSPGGNLAAGIELGRMLREMGFSTEVGADAEVCGTTLPCGTEAVDFRRPSFGGRASERRPGVCESACAYAFLGGVERTFDADSRLGFHRFALGGPAGEQRAAVGEVMARTQEFIGGLVIYVRGMGVSADVISLASATEAGQMRHVSVAEARELGVIHDPNAWRAWRLEAVEGGAVAVSETWNGHSELRAWCDAAGRPIVELTDRSDDPSDQTYGTWTIEGWFRQLVDCPFRGAHPVFGQWVPPANVAVSAPGPHEASIRFYLPQRPYWPENPALFDPEGGQYPNACTSERFRGTTEGFAETVSVAMRACLLR